MRPTRLGTAALLCSAVLLTGCASAAAGTSDETADALTDVLGSIDLEEVDPTLDPYDVAALPDGSYVVLLTGNLGTDNRRGSALVQLLPGDDGPTVGTVTEGAPYAGDGTGGEVHVADDGTVVALGPVLTGDGSDDEAWDVTLTVLAAGAETADVVPVEADPARGTPDDATAALSPDGATLYAQLEWQVRDDLWEYELVAIDVATGEVTATADLPEGTYAGGLAPLPDGGFVAVANVDRDHENPGSGVLLAGYDADLRPVGEPVQLLEDERHGLGYAVQALDDGTVLATVAAGQDARDGRLVTVRDGAVERSVALPGVARDVAADGQRAVLPLGTDDGGVAVATVDLASGEVVGQAPLCDGLGSIGAIASDGGTAVALGSCLTGDAEDPVWLVG